MVSEEAKVVKQSPEEKAQAPEAKKKVKIKAFPFGTGEENKDPQGSASGNKKVSEGEEPKATGSSEVREETPEDPLGKKEAKMPLDDEGKDFVKEAVRKGIEGLNEKVGVMEKAVDQNAQNTNTAVGKVERAVEGIREGLAEKTPKGEEGKAAPGTREQIAADAAELIRQGDEKRRQRLEQDEMAKKERNEHDHLRKLCLEDPNLPQCANVTELIDKRIAEKTVAKKEEEEPKVEPQIGLQPLEKMTDAKRDTMTEEQSLARDTQVKAILDKFNVSANDQARGILQDPTNKDNLVKKTELRESFIKTVTDEEALGIVQTRCEGDTCQIKFREGGIAVVKQDENGNWNLLDKEVAKKMKALF